MPARPLSPRGRDRYRGLVTVLTGIATAAAGAGIGAASGAAAADTTAAKSAALEKAQAARNQYERQLAARAQQLAAQTQPVLVPRPSRTVTTQRIVYAASSGPAIGGGTVRSRVASPAPAAPRQVVRPAPAAAPPPPPPPPPVVSAGS